MWQYIAQVLGPSSLSERRVAKDTKMVNYADEQKMKSALNVSA